MSPRERLAMESGWIALAVWDDDGGFRPQYTVDDEPSERILLEYRACFREPVPQALGSWAGEPEASAVWDLSVQRRDAARRGKREELRDLDDDSDRAKAGEVFLDFDPVCPEWPHHLPS